MKKLFIAAFIFVSTFTTNVFADIKMGIIKIIHLLVLLNLSPNTSYGSSKNFSTSAE